MFTIDLGKLKILVLIALLLFCPFQPISLFVDFSNAQSVAEELLNKIQNKFNSVNDLSADFKQLVNGNLKLEGKIFFKKENNLRFELDNSLLISNGKTSWNYNKKENKVIIMDNDEGTNYFSINKIVYEYPEMCKLSFETVDGSNVLVLIPESSDLKFSSAKLFINKDDLIFKAVIDDPAVGLLQLDFSNMAINSKLPDSDFSFTPPEGSKVIDLR